MQVLWHAAFMTCMYEYPSCPGQGWIIKVLQLIVLSKEHLQHRRDVHMT